MNARSKIDMIEATRLTREGRLEEAMTLLRGGRIHAPPSSVADDAPQIDMVSSSPATGDAWTSPQISEGHSRGKVIRQQKVLAALRPSLDHIRQLGSARGLHGLIEPAVGRAVVRVPEGAQFDEFNYCNEAGSRAYKLYVPSGYTGQSLPLVVMLHGCTQSPDDFAVGTRMNDLAEEQTFLVAYPEQPKSANVSKCWNWFNPSEQQRDQGEPLLIAGITRKIMREYSVESERVFIAGLSAGGAAAAIMGSTYPDLYAAIGVHSGLACGAATNLASAFEVMRHGGSTSEYEPLQRGRPGRDVPTIVFHGDRDMTVNPINGDQIIAQSNAAHLRTVVSRGEALGGINYTRTVWMDESGRQILEQWLLHGAGHAWSGGNPAGSYTEPRGPHASREMMRFFHECSPS